jgi:FAD/FMN-containing dehydrogenase
MSRKPHRTKLSGWGRYPQVDGLEVRSENLDEITRDAVLSRGLGRSYGDSSLPPRDGVPVANTTLADRFLAFDEASGLLRAEAGVSLFAINRCFLNRNWFSPVTPGTQFVALGGMVASDVHGKNHHVDGCFGEHVTSLRLRLADGCIVDCSPEQARDLFWATVGGMGLTGHILEVEFSMRRIPSPWIYGESERIANLDAMVEGLKQAAGSWPMTVGWIDCLAGGRRLGRGILMKGRWATADEAPARPPRLKRRLSIPFEFPGWVMSRPSIRAFNWLYYWKHVPAVKRGIVHPESFFYPLDAINDWNLIYGKRGFFQYQCVLPHAADNGPARRLLDLLRREGGISFLAVIKDCGAEGRGTLSFPRPGISIALDVPIRPQKSQALVDRLNELVIAEGGRIYLTKDAFTRPEHFRAMETRLDAFNEARSRWDPQKKFASAQSVRLLGDAP